MHIFLLCRHGETDWNRARRIQGHVDVPLNAAGRAQAQALAERLRPLGLHKIVSSDLSRAVETATIVAEALNLSVAREPRLREVHLGEAQGLDRLQLEARLGPELVARWRSKRRADVDVRYPGGESAREVVVRALAALRALAAEGGPGAAGAPLGIVSHGGLIARLLHALAPAELAPISVANAEVYALGYQPATDRFVLSGRPWEGGPFGL